MGTLLCHVPQSLPIASLNLILPCRSSFSISEDQGDEAQLPSEAPQQASSSSAAAAGSGPDHPGSPGHRLTLKSLFRGRGAGGAGSRLPSNNSEEDAAAGPRQRGQSE